MFEWIISKVAKPVLPVLFQAHKVLNLALHAMQNILDSALKSGIAQDSEICNNIKTIMKALSTIRTAVAGIITYLGGKEPGVLVSSGSSLEEEIEKLKQLL